MNENLKKNILKAKALWDTCRHAAMATVNADDSPHNTPFRFMHDSEFKYIYWASFLDAIYSQNILRTDKVFVVLYDVLDVTKGGLYMSAEDVRVLEGDEMAKVLAINNELRVKEGK